jgi:hypothetical protein
MATNPILLYNFNENSATTIRDYSEEGNDGAGTNLTVSSTTRNIGYDAVFNGTSSEITCNVSEISPSNEFSVYISIYLGSATGMLFSIASSGGSFVEWDGTTLTFTLNTFSTYTVTHNLSQSTWYDITFKYDGSDIILIVDGVEVNSTSTSGTFLPSTPTLLEIGHQASADYGDFRLNEFKIFNEAISDSNDLAFRNEQNGVAIKTSLAHGFNVGDVVGANLINGSAYFAIVTFVDNDVKYRMQPISDGITTGMTFSRCGHLWDTDRQYRLTINDTPEICFYNLITKSSEVFDSSKKLYCLNKNGIIKSSKTITSNYTVLPTDQRLYVDSSGGAFTITLEASPATNRELEIIDSVGSCGTNTVAVAGNGKNIVGNTTALMNSNYIAFVLVYNGTQWNLK